VRVAGQVAGDDHVVAVAEEGAQDATESDVDQGGVLAADVRATVLRFLEVVLLQYDVVDVEASREARLESSL
jgi:hypothetical protein